MKKLSVEIQGLKVFQQVDEAQLNLESLEDIDSYVEFPEALTQKSN